MYQIAVASVVWLNEWKKLKDKLGISNFSDLRHYSIIINSLNFHIWLSSFDGKEFTVLQLFRGGLDHPEGVDKYMEWWNAIHKWGLWSARSIVQERRRSSLGVPERTYYCRTDTTALPWEESKFGWAGPKLSNIEQFGVLVEDIVNKAQGVFIWVKSVVDELIEGWCEGDNIEEMKEILSKMPSE